MFLDRYEPTFLRITEIYTPLKYTFECITLFVVLFLVSFNLLTIIRYLFKSAYINASFIWPSSPAVYFLQVKIKIYISNPQTIQCIKPYEINTMVPR